jgi:hypothetical protein
LCVASGWYAGPIRISPWPSASSVSRPCFPTGIECVRRDWRKLRCHRLHRHRATVGQRPGRVTVECGCGRPRRHRFGGAELLWSRSVVCRGGLRDDHTDFHFGRSGRRGLYWLRNADVGRPCLQSSTIRERTRNYKNGCDHSKHANGNLSLSYPASTMLEASLCSLCSPLISRSDGSVSLRDLNETLYDGRFQIGTRRQRRIVADRFPSQASAARAHGGQADLPRLGTTCGLFFCWLARRNRRPLTMLTVRAAIR